jgi:hypothetical protein
MISSVTVGFLLEANHARLAFALPAAFSALGTVWIVVMARRTRRGAAS